jgi:sugar transferase EpsL
MSIMQGTVKRLLDLIIAATLLLFALPVLFIVFLVILFSMGHPVLFKQLRPGHYGKPFLLYKFRTMSQAADHGGNLLPDAARLTRLGSFLRRTSLDELPQLLNVLKGEMSLVGPRPLLMEYLPLYNDRQARRHEVRPGITGWAQVNGRNALNWADKFNLDVWYVENQSLGLDMKVLWMTLLKVMRREGISQQGQATAEKFKGNVGDSQNG